MKKIFVIFTVFITILFAKNIQTRIINGVNVYPGDNPWTISLYMSKYNSAQDGHFCGGSIISKNWVLTAAHCFENIKSISDFKVYSGSVFLNSGGESHSVKRYIKHPYYDNYTVDYDIALIEIYGEFKETPIKLANYDSPYYNIGTYTTVTGWGSTNPSNYQQADRLMEVSVPIVSNETCNSPYSYNGDITDRMMCAGYKDGGKDACIGDSGGPLFVETNGEALQIGIVSWGIGCAMANYYGVYTRVGLFKSWIESYTGDLDGEESTISKCDTKLMSMVTNYNTWYLLGTGEIEKCSVEGLRMLGAKSVYYYYNNTWHISGVIDNYQGVWIMK